MFGLLQQIMKFGIVGVLATGIDFGVMVFLHELFGVDAIIAAGVSFVVSLAFNYLASMRYVFERRDDLTRTQEATIFIVLSLFGLVINELIMLMGQLLLEKNGVPFQSGFAYVAVKVIATGVVMVWNFLSRKHWLERSRT